MMINGIRKALLCASLYLACTFQAFAAYPVNINTASAEMLAETLSGVGEIRAEAIVAWREENGPFTSVEQLTEVSGVGQAVLERNREYLLLE